MSSNHKAAAENLLPASGEGMQPSHIAAAQAHATLYLAEQQRIANLIAWANSPAENFSGEFGSEIKRALGV